MNKLTTFAALAGISMLLAACGSADDASTEATADTVEMPADEALEAISEAPVEDPDATATETEDLSAETDAAADAASDVAAEAAAAAEAADAATE